MAAAAGRSSQAAQWAMLKEGAISYGYVAVWIVLSATVIMYNKYILSYFGFPFPVTLTMWHMFFCSMAAFILVRGKYVAPIEGMTRELYVKTIVPIGALFSVNLWLGNTAYLYLSVSFIQMLKALMPASVFTVGCLLGTESFRLSTAGNMVLVTAGVAVASYGEVNFVVVGVIAQLVAIAAEATRLSLVQVLLQKRGLKLNPVTSLYYIAPCCFGFLAIPWACLELPQLLHAADPVRLDPVIFVSNATAAFALNMSVFLLIGRTSALTMNIAGVVKDWLLIGLSVAIYHSAISRLNLGGYIIAFAAVGLSPVLSCLVCYYNLQKIGAAKAAAASTAAKPRAVAGEEGVPLVERRAADAARP